MISFLFWPDKLSLTFLFYFFKKFKSSNSNIRKLHIEHTFVGLNVISNIFFIVLKFILFSYVVVFCLRLLSCITCVCIRACLCACVPSACGGQR